MEFLQSYSLKRTLSLQTLRKRQHRARLAWQKQNASTLAGVMPLRKSVYARLAERLLSCQLAGQALGDLMAELITDVRRSPETALLMADLWEVIKEADRRYAFPEPKFFNRAKELMRELEELPFTGEEVLF